MHSRECSTSSTSSTACLGFCSLNASIKDPIARSVIIGPRVSSRVSSTSMPSVENSCSQGVWCCFLLDLQVIRIFIYYPYIIHILFIYYSYIIHILFKCHSCIIHVSFTLCQSHSIVHTLFIYHSYTLYK